MLETSEFFADRNGNAPRLQEAGRKIAGFFIQTLGKSFCRCRLVEYTVIGGIQKKIFRFPVMWFIFRVFLLVGIVRGLSAVSQGCRDAGTDQETG